MIQARNIAPITSALVKIGEAVRIDTTERTIITYTIPEKGRYFLQSSLDINILNQTSIGNSYIALSRNGAVIADSQRFFNFNNTYFVGGVTCPTLVDCEAGDVIRVVGKTATSYCQAQQNRGNLIAIRIS